MVQLIKQLFDLTLEVAPRALWWGLAMVVFAAANLVWQQEVWPNTPLAGPAFCVLLSLGVSLLAIVGPWTLWLVGGRMTWWLARAAMKSAAVVAGLAAVPVLLGLLVAAVYAGVKAINPF